MLFILIFLFTQCVFACLRKSCSIEAICLSCSLHNGDDCSNVIAYMKYENNCLTHSYNSEDKCLLGCDLCFKDSNKNIQCVLCDNQVNCSKYNIINNPISQNNTNSTKEFDPQQLQKVSTHFDEQLIKYSQLQILIGQLDKLQSESPPLYKEIGLLSIGIVLICLVMVTHQQMIIRLIINLQTLSLLLMVSNSNISWLINGIFNRVEIVPGQRIHLIQFQYYYLTVPLKSTFIIFIGFLLCSFILSILRYKLLGETNWVNNVYIVSTSFSTLLLGFSFTSFIVRSKTQMIISIIYMVFLIVLLGIGLKYYQDNKKLNGQIGRYQYMILFIYSFLASLMIAFGVESKSKYFILPLHAILILLMIITQKQRWYWKLNEVCIIVCMVDILFIKSCVLFIIFLSLYLLIVLVALIQIVCLKCYQSQQSRIKEETKSQ